MAKTVTYHYEDPYEVPAELLWERCSDTNRLHEISGIVPYSATEKILPDKSTVRTCIGKIGKAKAIWQERFGEWKAPYYLKQRRDFITPFKGSVILETRVVPTQTGSKQIIDVSYVCTSLMSRLFAFLGLFKKMTDSRVDAKRKFVLSDDRATPVTTNTWKKPFYKNSTLNKVKSIIDKINASAFGNNLGKKLADYAMHALAIDAAYMRPLELAKKWKISDDKMIEACLQAMSCGLLDMHWDILCPQCRVSKAETSGLHDLPKNVHCPSCNINFTLNFNDNVEMTFLPAKWLRPIEETTFCMLSAQLTPHIIVQYRIDSGKEETYELPLKPGKYRCRSLEDQYSLMFEISAGDKEFPVIELTDKELKLLPEKNKNLTLINHSSFARYFIVEKTTYAENALTGQKVSTMHVFRQLCPEQLLRAGDNIGISNLVIMFTDLKDSTAFYYEVGETKAYHVVREHFGMLSEIIYKHHGTIVKTIGDSVMAVFDDPKDAVLASLKVQKTMAEFNQKNNSAIQIKLGLHQGNCIAVNVNNIMDYFGTTVNIAARLHGLSNGKDVLISEVLMQDPAVHQLLANAPQTKHSEFVKGIPDPVVFYQIEINNP